MTENSKSANIMEVCCCCLAGCKGIGLVWGVDSMNRIGYKSDIKHFNLRVSFMEFLDIDKFTVFN